MEYLLEHSLDVISHFNELLMENSNMGFLNNSYDNFQPSFDNFSSILPGECPKITTNQNTNYSIEDESKEVKKRNVDVASDTTSMSSSATASETMKKNSSRSVKSGREKTDEVEKPLMEVVHVRARRGQATDSHSLAERVRREKINERMRCLQDLVPGCYKTMGMAGMLDEIINYVQSLQNQVEFLSMKLSAASSFSDLRQNMQNTSTEQVFPMMGDAYQEPEEMERLMREAIQGFTSFQPATHF